MKPSLPHTTTTVKFNLTPAHRDTNGAAWRQQQLTTINARKRHENASMKQRRRTRTEPTNNKGTRARLSKAKIIEGINNGTIPAAISDTGATSTAGKPGDPFQRYNSQKTKVFHLPTGSTTTSSHQAKLHLPVRAPANIVDVVPNLTQTLLSGSKFADAGYTAVYDEDEVNFYESNKIKITAKAVLQGYRCPSSGLWRVPLVENICNVNTDTLLLDAEGGEQSLNKLYEVPSSQQIRDHLKAARERDPEDINNVYELPSIEQSIRYLHGAAGFPTKATWLKAIRRGNYDTWPLINVKNVHKHFPESEETQHGHMRNQRQGVRSTKQRESEPTNPAAPVPKQNEVLVRVYDTHNTLFTDQTGKFPHLSSRGNRYQMILYHAASNSIWVEPMKNRTEGEIIQARARALTRMKTCGITPERQVLDNEASAAYKDAIRESGMTFQLVPPDDHRRNAAEKAIQTWKDHFIAALSGTADDFPLHLWCQAIPQMERQLCLLRQTNINPKISTYAYLYGPHNYNAEPFVPIGMQALVHDKPQRRRTFAQHCSKGWVLATSPEHYRCWKVWTKTTRTTRISGTMFFKHKYITNPTVTPADTIIAAASNLADALRKNVKAQTIGQIKYADLKRLQAILANSQARESNLAPPEMEIAGPPRVEAPNSDGDRGSNPPQSNTGIPPAEEVPIDSSFRVLNPPQRNASALSPRVENNATSPRVIPTVSQEEISDPASSPARNTRSRRTINQDIMLSMINIHRPNMTARQAVSRQFPKEALAAVLNEETGELMEYRHLLANPKYRTTWSKAYGKEIGRLAQGIPGEVEGTNTITFIDKSHIPQNRWRDVTYGRIVASFRPEKEDPNRIRLTVGGNRINFTGDCGTPTADMLTVKLLLNSIISTKGARFMTIDIKDFYLNTPMARPEYMRLKIDDMPDNVIKQYQLREKSTKDGYVYVEINKGMYGLPQAGIIAQQLLEKRLNAAGYHQSTITPGFWKHDWRPISFALCVDDFGVKYVGEEHAKHLLRTLNKEYKTSSEWEGKRYIGLTLEWDYINRYVHVSMPGYCEKACQRFHHHKPKKPQDQPYPHVEPTYGSKQQYAQEEDQSPTLSKEDKTFIQEVIGVFLYYARAVDCTMLAALGSLASQQATPTENTMKKVKQFLDYAATHQDATITYRASDMIIAVHSDASYLSETNARSRAGGHFFLSENDEFPTNNGAVLTISQIIKVVMSSAAEAEIGALYINAREAIPQRQLLEEMGHPQPPTPIQIDNTTALGVVTNTIQPKRTKAMDMRFHWLRCRKNQKQFRTYWRAGPTNNGDYVTKHHPAIHHTAVRSTYLTSMKRLDEFRRRAAEAITRVKLPARVC